MKKSRAISSIMAVGTLVGGFVASSVPSASAGAETEPVTISNVSALTSAISGGREQDAMSSDGRYVVFIGRNKTSQGVYRVDRMKGTFIRVSTSSDQNPSISADGRYIAFARYGSNRVVYLYDAVAGTTQAVSVNPDGSPASGISDFPSVSKNGTTVAFQTSANLGGTYASSGGSPTEIYAYNTQTKAMTPVSATTTAGVTTLGNANSVFASITPNGRYVVFASAASNLLPTTSAALGAQSGSGETSTTVQQIYVHDMVTGINSLVSSDAAGVAGDASSASTYGPTISDNGQYVAFESAASNLVPADTNGQTDAFVKDLSTGAITRVSVAADGSQVTAPTSDLVPTAIPVAGQAPRISGNGNFVAFESDAALTPDDVNGVRDIYVRDMVNNTVVRASVSNASGTDATGTRIDGKTGATILQINGADPAISFDGRYVTFLSNGNLAGDRVVSTEGGVTSTSTEGAIYARTFRLPTVTSISPANLGRARVGISVTVTGTNFSAPAAVDDLAVSLGAGVRVNSVLAQSPTTLVLNVTTSYDAPTTSYDVTVTNPGGDSATLAGAFALSARGTGYRLAGSDGGVFTFGDAGFYGSMGGVRLNAPVVGITDSSSGNGYWLVASDGGVFTFGDAGFYGSMGGVRLNKPVVGDTATTTSAGYWLVASDGGIFTFGDAGFYGSLGATHLNAPVVSMARTPDSAGYWLVASDGGVFTFGDAGFYGSLGAFHLSSPIVGMAATPSGKGYWLTSAVGEVFAFGDAQNYGSMAGTQLNAPIVAIVALPDSGGYWLVASDGGVFSFGTATFMGSMVGVRLNGSVAGMSAD